MAIRRVGSGPPHTHGPAACWYRTRGARIFAPGIMYRTVNLGGRSQRRVLLAIPWRQHVNSCTRSCTRQQHIFGPNVKPRVNRLRLYRTCTLQAVSITYPVCRVSQLSGSPKLHVGHNIQQPTTVMGIRASQFPRSSRSSSCGQPYTRIHALLPSGVTHCGKAFLPYARCTAGSCCTCDTPLKPALALGTVDS